MATTEAPLLTYTGPEDQTFSIRRYTDRIGSRSEAFELEMRTGTLLSQALRFYVDDELWSEHELGIQYTRGHILAALKDEVRDWIEHKLDADEVEAKLNDLESKL